MFSFFKKNKKDKNNQLKEINKDTLEEILVGFDIEYDLVERLLSKSGKNVKIKTLQQEMLSLFNSIQPIELKTQKPFVEIMIGVNGAGKTTTIAKLAHKYKSAGNNVLLGAGDTFRAAAVEQLSLWANKLDVGIVKAQKGSDPSAVAYNTLSSAVAKNIDNVIIDTAGRLQNQGNLLNELEKIIRVSKKIDDSFPHRKILIIDAMQGNMAIEQARVFKEKIGIDAIIITKLDGTSRGGAILSIVDELKIPILHIGTGEKKEDLIDFVAENYVQDLIEYISTPDNE